MVLPMARIDLLSVRPHQALLPHNSTVCITACLDKACVGGRRLWLVGRVLSLALLVERGMPVATFRILKGDASMVVGGVFRKGCAPGKGRLGLGRGRGGLWGSGRTRRTLSSVIHRGECPSKENETQNMHAEGRRACGHAWRDKEGADSGRACA